MGRVKPSYMDVCSPLPFQGKCLLPPTLVLIFHTSCLVTLPGSPRAGGERALERSGINQAASLSESGQKIATPDPQEPALGSASTRSSLRSPWRVRLLLGPALKIFPAASCEKPIELGHLEAESPMSPLAYLGWAFKKQYMRDSG
ncbi:unnamed protein product [Eretmochelys imbricata]